MNADISTSEDQAGDSSTKLSIVIPAYNEAGNLEVLSLEINNALAAPGVSYEIIFVDDGSTDGTWSVITKLHNEYGYVRGVRLSRNFGHQYALLAGLNEATGDAVITMDADMQHPPEVIPKLVHHWRQGNRIVKTVRQDTKDISAFKRLTSRLYYRLFSYLSGVEIQSGMADFRLLDRQVVEDVLKFKEEGLFLRGIVQWVGYPSAIVSFDCGNRYSGASKYTIGKMIRFAWHGVSSFSLVPLRVLILVGLFSSGIAFAGVLYAIVSKWLVGDAVPGWTSSVAIISFLFGILFIFLAVLAEYVGKILQEVRERPRYLISEKHEISPAEELHGERRV